jgi:hypothetical protein
MELERDNQSTVEIAIFGKPMILPMRVHVFIDGRKVGMLGNQCPQVFEVLAGTRRVQVKGLIRQSEVLHLPLSVGERVVLECGWDGREENRPGWFRLAGVLAVIPLTILTLPLTGLATLLVGAFLGLVGEWRLFVEPGGYLYLKPQGARRIPSSAIPRHRPPQFTLRRLMAVVGIVGLLTWIGLLERERQANRTQQGIAKTHTQQAEGYQEELSTLKNHFERNTKLERITTEAIESATSALASDPANHKLHARIRELQYQRQLIQNQQAFLSRRSTYVTQLRDKYLRAAARPWEPVDPDPSPPP